MTYGARSVSVLGAAADWSPPDRSGATFRDPSAGGMVKDYINEGRNETAACKEMATSTGKELVEEMGKVIPFKVLQFVIVPAKIRRTADNCPHSPKCWQRFDDYIAHRLPNSRAARVKNVGG